MKTLYYTLKIFWGRARSKMLGAPLNKGLAGNRIHQLKLVLIPKMLNGWKPWRITGQWNPRARLPGPHLQRTLWLLGQHLAELVVAHGVLPKSEWKGYVYWGRGLVGNHPKDSRTGCFPSQITPKLVGSCYLKSWNLWRHPTSLRTSTRRNHHIKVIKSRHKIKEGTSYLCDHNS